jgi:hypothetical protein
LPITICIEYEGQIAIVMTAIFSKLVNVAFL